MIHVKRPADPLDLLSFQTARGRTLVSLRGHIHLHVQLLGGPSCAVYRAGQAAPVALAGIYLGAEKAVVWFAIDAAVAASPGAIAGVVFALRPHLRAEAQLSPIVAEIEAGNAAGERLARALGFHLDPATGAESIRAWVLTGG